MIRRGVSTLRGVVLPTRPPVRSGWGDTPLAPRPFDSGWRRAQGRLWGFAPLDARDDGRRVAPRRGAVPERPLPRVQTHNPGQAG